LISGGSGIRKAVLQYEEMGPARPLGRRPLRPQTRAYDNCVRLQWQSSCCTSFSVSLFLPVLPASLGRAAPPSRKLISGGSGIRKAGLQYEEMGPARPLGRRPLRPRTRAYVNCVRIPSEVRSYQH
ncbi:hypothetical protein PIB30_112346, partial [Stylosanthes scabra]|nr:hypothetical protein [Stylosanthes scabra]